MSRNAWLRIAKSRIALFACWLVVAVVFVLLQPQLGLSQAPLTSKAPLPRTQEEMLRMSLAAEKPGLAEPFRGITTHGKVESGLFGIRSTGVSTEPVRQAAAAFLASLDNEQRNKTQFPVDSDEWRKWMNQSFYIRQGVSFLEMNGKQREAAFNLLRAGLSVKGLQLTRDIMRLNETLAEMTNNKTPSLASGSTTSR